VVRDANDFADMWVLMGAVLATTRRLKFALGIHVLPLRHPLLTARALTTGDELGSGRVILGVGAGWMREEFDALGVRFEERGPRLDEGIAVLRDALDGVTSFEGEFFQYRPLVVSAERVDVPIVIGGATPRALRRAARVADGWYGPTTLDVEACLRIRGELHRLRREYGTIERPFSMSVRVTPQDPDSARRYDREGFDQLVLDGESIWPTKRAFTLEEKLVALEETVDRFGLRQRLAVSADQPG
jgi:alkanesulfonate monooxygenase SsuD/methylene tetrahydromethanopterin reductase-like flavin-dependent oxidoreductase (luciferase family)